MDTPEQKRSADSEIHSQAEMDCAACAPRNTARDLAEIAAAFVILFAAFLLLQHFAVLPRGFTISDNMTYGLILLIGLAASISTCIAVTGGLLVAIAAKYNEAAGSAQGTARFQPHLFFNAGRILGYAFFGGLIGALGSALALSAGVNGALMIVASVIMIVIGLQMLRLLPPFGLARSLVPESFARRAQDFSQRQTNPAAFLFGASTFFLPCGFTQALQLYVLAKGSAAAGALTMLVFALGTLPALLSLSLLSSYARGGFQRYFLKLAGAAVVFLGLVNIEYGLVLTGSGVNVASVVDALRPTDRTADGRAVIVNGQQVVEMKVVGLDYEPHQFVVTQGVPVVWRISAEEAEGCGRVLIVPKLRIRKFLTPQATNVIVFTPDASGEIEFNCGMGMMTPNSKFTVVAGLRG